MKKEKEDDDDDTPPNSPRRRRIISTGVSKSIKSHLNSEDKNIPPPSLSLISTTQLKQQQTIPSLIIPSTTHSSTNPSTHPSSHPSTHPSHKSISPTLNNNEKNEEIVSWNNLSKQKKPKIEKFLWDANISDEIGKVDNYLLKVVLIFNY